MITHGIDEAGYGPLLGPLVVARTDFSTEGGCGVRVRRRKRPLVRIADSKKLLARADGFAALETAVLGCCRALGGPKPETVSDWLALDGRRDLPADLERQPWYRGLARRLPLEAEPDAVAAAADEVAQGRVFAGGRLAGLTLRVVSERALNQSLDRTENKHLTLFNQVVELIEEALPAGPDHSFTIDKLGGRHYYADRLSAAFPFTPIEVEAESPADSRYALDFPHAAARLRFLVKGDDRSPEVALASMCAKYTRELLMSVYNDYWEARVPGIRRTAGYYSDGRRFLADLEERKVLDPELERQLVRRR